MASARLGSGGLDIVAVDSVAALVPKAELDYVVKWVTVMVGLARAVDVAGVGYAKLTGTVARTNTLLGLY